MNFLANYGLFLAKTITVIAGILVVLIVLAAIKQKQSKKGHDGEIDVEKINDNYDDLEETLQEAVLTKDELKQLEKDKKQAEKKKKKAKKDEDRKRVFVLSFDGDIRASEVELLREEITAVLTIAKKTDEVVILLESAGGMVHTYGLAASQLQRIRDKEIPLTICVDQVAASGGYMMACVGNQILAAPFAIVGSIGVLAQIPNFNKLLRKHDVEFEQITAGKYKRTLTMFGENTKEAREKFTEDMEEVHELFKQFIIEHRPDVDIEKVATGEHWFGKQALGKKLVDKIITSDDYLMELKETADIYQVSYDVKQSIGDKIQHFVEGKLFRASQYF